MRRGCNFTSRLCDGVHAGSFTYEEGKVYSAMITWHGKQWTGPSGIGLTLNSGHFNNILLLFSAIMESQRYMCYACTKSSDSTDAMLHHAMNYHINNSFSLRVRCLDDKTDEFYYKSQHYNMQLSSIYQMLQRGDKVVIDNSYVFDLKYMNRIS